MSQTTFLTDADVAAVAEWPELIEAMRLAYGVAAEPQSLPPRTMARADGSWLRSLSAMPAHSEYMGAKLIAASPSNHRVSYLIALFDRATTELVALLDANHVTTCRTAATSAVAIDFLAPDRPLRVAVVGSGLEARNHVTALAAVREIESLAVFSPTPAKRDRFADAMSEATTAQCRAAASAQDAVSDAELVIAAARSHDESPTVRGEWLVPGTVVVSIGSTLPEQHEVDVEVIRRASTIFADVPEEVATETGDMLEAAAAGVDFGSKLYGLEDLVRGFGPARDDPAEILLYKSVGSARQDITVAELCLRRALDQGRGSALPISIQPISK